MKSNYVIVSIKIRLDLGNDGYIILYNFGDRIMSGFKVIEGGPPGPGAKKQGGPEL